MKFWESPVPPRRTTFKKPIESLQKKLHPDLNPGNAEAEEKFKEIAGAYDLVGDAEKRKRFDDGEIDAAGAERPRQNYYRDYASSDQNHPYADNSGFTDFMDPGGSSAELSFSEIDIARVQLIRDLQIDFGVNDEGVGVILNLVDQLYDMRRTLMEMRHVVRTTSSE